MEQLVKSVQSLNRSKRWDYRFHQQKFGDLESRLDKSPHPLSTLKQVTDHVIDGTHFTPQYTDAPGVLFLMARNIRPFEISLDEVSYITQEEHQRIIRCKPEPGDVLVTKDGTIGVAAVVPNNLPEFNIFVSVIKARPTPVLSPHYLAAFLNSELGQLQIQQQIKGASIVHIHLEDIRRVRLPIPPRPIQDRIAHLMKDAYAARRAKLDEAEKLLGEIDAVVIQHLYINLDRLSQEKRYLYPVSELKRWDLTYSLPHYRDIETAVQSGKYPCNQFGNLVEFSSGTVDPSKQPDLQIAYVEIGDVDAALGEVVSHRKILGADAPSRARRLVRTGDIVTAVSGVLTGTKGQATFTVPDYLNGAIVSTGFMVLRPKPGVLPGYVSALLASDFFLKMIWRRKTGAAIPAIAESDFKSIPTPLPPTEVQKKIVSEFSHRRIEAKRLRAEAEAVIAEAKAQVERMILGEEDSA